MDEIDEQLNLALALSASEAEQSRVKQNVGHGGSLVESQLQMDADAALALRIQEQQVGAQPSYVSRVSYASWYVCCDAVVLCGLYGSLKADDDSGLFSLC